jgi:integrase
VDITSSFKIKNRAILDKCDDLIREYRQRINALNLELNDMPLQLIVERITSRSASEGVDFVEFVDKWMEKNATKPGLATRRTAVNAFIRFFGRDIIMCSEITSKVMREFEQSLTGVRNKSSYPTTIMHLFREARKYYNDEDNDRIVIRNTVASYKPPKQNVAKKRALTEETVRRILALEYNGSVRRDLALDMFKLSFFLMGTNSIDLYNATQYDGEWLVYNRTKTAGQRSDKAEMRIRVHPCLLPLFEKYKGEERVFNFYMRYSNPKHFNGAINAGLKEIAEEVGEEKIQFYAIRHSFATIAVNTLKINKYIVNDMLCHVDPAMQVTELYIRKDYAPMNEANFQFIDYFLK